MFLLAVNQAQNNDKLITDMQDKFTEIQQHEIEFLNNFITHLGWMFGGIVTLIGLVIVYIGYANRQAEKKMKEAEKVLGAAQTAKEEMLQYKADLEEYRKTTENKFKELTDLVSSKEVADLKETTELISMTNRIDSLIFEIRDIINKGQDRLWNLRQELNNSSIGLKFENQYLEVKDELNTIRKKSIKGIRDRNEVELYLLKSLKMKKNLNVSQIGLQSLRTAKRILAGIEAMHMIKKDTFTDR